MSEPYSHPIRVGGRALAARLRAAGLGASNAKDVAEHALAREIVAIREVRQAGREIGQILAGLVNTFNPAVMVIGGALSLASDDLLASIREVVYRRSPPLATRQLQILPSQAGPDVGMIGAGILIAEYLLAPDLASVGA